MPVNAQHEDYRRMLPKWQRCRDVSEGQDAVQGAGEAYLPKLKEQTPEDYLAYVKRAMFYNATWRTVAGLVGMLLRKPPVVKVPKPVEELLEDVTMSGVPLQLFVQEVCEEALKQGRLGVLVDYPSVDVQGMTLADAQQQNLRPTMCVYRTESIINWRKERVNNVWTLVLVVLKEKYYERTNEFEQKCEDRYRVLDLTEGKYRVRMYKVQDTRDVLLNETFPLMGNKPLAFVPFTFLSTDDNTDEVDDPPLIDLVDVNLSHYRTSADLEHGAHFTGLPTPWVAGHMMDNPGEKLYIGSQAAWVFRDPLAKCGYLEFSGQGLEALETRLANKEKQMAVLGARMLEPQQKGVETAERASIHRKGEESMLSAAAQALSLGLERALRWFCQWSGADVAAKDAVECELNREFYPTPMSDKMLTALVMAWQQGAISFETLFDNLQGGDVIDGDKTAEEEQAAIGDTPPKLQGLGVDPVTGEPAAPTKLPKEAAPKPRIKPRSTTITTPKGEQYTIQHGD